MENPSAEVCNGRSIPLFFSVFHTVSGLPGLRACVDSAPLHDFRAGAATTRISTASVVPGLAKKIYAAITVFGRFFRV